MKKLTIILASGLLMFNMGDMIRYFYFGFVPSMSDMVFLYVMTIVGIGNMILEELNQ